MVVGYAGVYIFAKFRRKKESKGEKKNKKQTFNRRAEGSIVDHHLRTLETQVWKLI